MIIENTSSQIPISAVMKIPSKNLYIRLPQVPSFAEIPAKMTVVTIPVPIANAPARSS